MKHIPSTMIGVMASTLLLQMATAAHAGMPSSLRLSQYVTKYGAERMIGLSTGVFLGLLVSTLIIRACWGVLVRDTNWPKPTLPKSFAATLLGGILFFLVIVMIAGSRELFSPGAWEPDGVLYKLASSPSAQEKYAVSFSAEIKTDRHTAIVALRDHLKTLRTEDGFPTWDEMFAKTTITQSIRLEYWTIPFASGMRYEYHPDQNDGPWLAVEPPALEQQTPDIKRLAIDRGTLEIVEVPSENHSKTSEAQP